MHDLTEEKRCTKCKEYKPYSKFPSAKASRDGVGSWCRACVNVSVTEINSATPQRRMHLSSRINASIKGKEHTITIDDIPIPKTCKYLGITIDYRKASERGRLRSFDAPSIDRIDPMRGYVVGNIQVISDLANRMKQDATIDQLIAFAKGVLKEHT